MSENDLPDRPAEPGDEPVLARWSRLKARARERDAQPTTADGAATVPAAAVPAPAPPAVSEPPPVQLPDLEQLDQDSDYSAFLTPGVDAELRRRALRKLFHSPKFNVFDGLDTYRDDFTSFPALGSVVTADLRYQLERAAKEIVARAEGVLDDVDGRPCEAPVPAVSEDPSLALASPPTERNENEDDAEHGPA